MHFTVLRSQDHSQQRPLPTGGRGDIDARRVPTDKPADERMIKQCSYTLLANQQHNKLC